MTTPTGDPGPGRRSRNTPVEAVRTWRARASLVVVALLTMSTLADVDWFARPFLAIAFFLAIPGLAIVGAVGLEDAVAEATVGIALSIALSTAVAMVMLWCHAWHPAVAEVVLAVAVTPLLVRQADLRPTPHPVGRHARADAPPTDGPRR